MVQHSCLLRLAVLECSNFVSAAAVGYHLYTLHIFIQFLYFVIKNTVYLYFYLFFLANKLDYTVFFSTFAKITISG